MKVDAVRRMSFLNLKKLQAMIESRQAAEFTLGSSGDPFFGQFISSD
jgi:hypothetical protein